MRPERAVYGLQSRDASVFYTISLFFASFFALFTVFLSHACCISFRLCSLQLWSLLSSDLVSCCLYCHCWYTFFLLSSFMCRALFLSHYDQRGGRHVAELRVKATQEGLQMRRKREGCCIVSAVRHSDWSVVG